MQSSKWGPLLNSSLFYIAAGYDSNDTPKAIKDKQYKAFFKSLGDVLPCKYCRDSYKVFFETLDIDKYMESPACGLVKYYYDFRELVNGKLKLQEQNALKEEFEKLSKQMSQNDPLFWEIMREKGHKICYTKPTPPLEQVIDELMKHRAGCNKELKTCREPLLNNMYPRLPDVKILGLQRSGPTDRELYSGGASKPSRKASRKRKVSKRTSKIVKKKSKVSKKKSTRKKR